jgi:hypothetical protein
VRGWGLVRHAADALAEQRHGELEAARARLDGMDGKVRASVEAVDS